MTSLVLFMAPAAQHRLMRPLKDRAAFKRSANRLIVIGLVPMSAVFPLMTYFVVSDVVGRLATTVVAGAVGLLVRGALVESFPPADAGASVLWPRPVIGRREQGVCRSSRSGGFPRPRSPGRCRLQRHDHGSAGFGSDTRFVDCCDPVW